MRTCRWHEYADFVFKAVQAERAEPGRGRGRRLGTAQQRLCDFLDQAVKEMHIRRRRAGPTCGWRSRAGKWINCDGENNFPDGEVFTGPIEDAAEGTVFTTRFPAVVRPGARSAT
jgi:aminopeptidase